jgi:peptidoglycan/LPS O-acetylase OafA/YrhL
VTQPQEPSGATAAGPTYFPALDSMRAVGAFAVLTTHVSFWAGAYLQHGWLGTLLARLDVGVAIFFALSGFLLARPFLARARDARPAPRTRTYFLHRFLRIAPVYAVTAVLALALIRDNADLTWSDRFVTLVMANTFTTGELPAGLTHMWSLAVEVCFYLLLPVLMWLVLGRNRLSRPRMVSVLTVMVLVSLAWHLGGDALDRLAPFGSPQQWLPAYLSWFAAGIAMAMLHVTRGEGRALGRLGTGTLHLASMPGTCWALACGLLLVSATPLAGPSMLEPATPAEATFKHVAYLIIATLLVLPAVFAPPTSRFQRSFSHPVLRHVGLISYGIFCLHLPILHLVMWVTGYQLFDGHWLQIWVLTVVLSLVAAEVVYRLIEGPIQRLRRSRIDRSEPPEIASTDMSEASTR